MTEAPVAPEVRALLDPWPDQDLPHLGGLPPWDRVTPVALEAAYRAAVESKRGELRAVAGNPAPPTFENTIEALEDSGRALARLQTLLSAFSQTMASGEMPAVTQRLAPLAPALEDAIAHDEQLFARVAAVYGGRSRLDAERKRLVEVVHERLLRRGAALPAAQRARLAQINARCAELFATFARNLQADEKQLVWIGDERRLAGATEGLRRMLKQAAVELGRSGEWAVRNLRAFVWPFLTQCADRALREQVWRMWTDRGDHAGEHDNKPVVAEMLQLRGEKARLLGYASFAHYATAERMARTPEAALAMLERTWQAVLARTERQITAYQAVADADPARGPGVPLAPWDRLHYAERLRRRRFGFDSEALRPYLRLDAMLQAMFWAAGRLHGVTFHALPSSVPRLDPSIEVYELRREGTATGVLYVDLFARPGKGHGSYQTEWRSAETFRGRVLPISCITSNLPKPAAGEPTLLAWEYANVFFHEFGHAMHMLANATCVPVARANARGLGLRRAALAAQRALAGRPRAAAALRAPPRHRRARAAGDARRARSVAGRRPHLQRQPRLPGRRHRRDEAAPAGRWRARARVRRGGVRERDAGSDGHARGLGSGDAHAARLACDDRGLRRGPVRLPLGRRDGGRCSRGVRAGARRLVRRRHRATGATPC
ncbi:MAG: M3 family metallopeptidase [Rubrivivax sp.]